MARDMSSQNETQFDESMFSYSRINELLLGNMYRIDPGMVKFLMFLFSVF